MEILKTIFSFTFIAICSLIRERLRMVSLLYSPLLLTICHSGIMYKDVLEILQRSFSNLTLTAFQVEVASNQEYSKRILNVLYRHIAVQWQLGKGFNLC